MCLLLVFDETKEQVALEMYAKYSAQLSEAPPTQENDVNNFIPAQLHKQALPMEVSPVGGLLTSSKTCKCQ